MAGCLSSHQPTRIREETLESGGPLQRELNFRLRTRRGGNKQFILIYVIAITNIVNLTMEAKNDTLWTSLLSASLGYMLPAPHLNNHKKKQI